MSQQFIYAVSVAITALIQGGGRRESDFQGPNDWIYWILNPESQQTHGGSRESQDSLLPMRFKLRLFMMSWAESTTWPWLFGRDPSCVIFSTCENRALCVCTLGRSASSSTLDTRKICTTLLFLCSRCKPFIAFFWQLPICAWNCDSPMILVECGSVANKSPNCEIKSICKQISNCEIKSPSAANKSPISDVIQNIDAQLVCHQGLVAGLPCLASTRKKRWCTICHSALKFRLFAHRTMAVQWFQWCVFCLGHLQQFLLQMAVA